MGLAVVAHIFNNSTQEIEACGYLGDCGQPGLPSEFQYSQSCTEKSCLEINRKRAPIAPLGFFLGVFHFRHYV